MLLLQLPRPRPFPLTPRIPLVYVTATATAITIVSAGCLRQDESVSCRELLGQQGLVYRIPSSVERRAPGLIDNIRDATRSDSGHACRHARGYG